MTALPKKSFVINNRTFDNLLNLQTPRKRILSVTILISIMKLICISALFCLSSLFDVVTYLRVSPKNDNRVGNGFLRQNRGLGNQCSFIADRNFRGSNTLMDYDQSNGGSQGDMSIANTLSPTTDNRNYPIIKSMCTNMALRSAPFCTIETTFADGGKIMLMGTPPALTIIGGRSTCTYVGVWGSMATRNLVRYDNGDISFTARIDYCITEVCENDPGWHTQHNEDCDYVGMKPDKRCSRLVGSNNIMNGGARVLASDACQEACGC